MNKNATLPPSRYHFLYITIQNGSKNTTKRQSNGCLFYLEEMKMRRFYVYKHIRLDNMACFYVGLGSGNRAYQKKRNKHHDAVAEKYGCVVEIIRDGLTLEEAQQLETDTIKNYVLNEGYGIDIKGYNNFKDEKGRLANKTWGGEGTKGCNPYTNKTEEELKEWHKKRSISSSGENNGMYGRKHTDEAKKRLAELAKGRECSKETRKRMSESQKARHRTKSPDETDEWKIKISKALSGRMLSEEHKRRLSQSRMGLHTGVI